MDLDTQHLLSFTIRGSKVKFNCWYSTWRKLKKGVLQWSILGQLLFNIFLNDIIIYVVDKSNLDNFADDNTAHSTEELLALLKYESTVLLDWFMVRNRLQTNAYFKR